MRFVKIENGSLLDKGIGGLRKESFLTDSKDRWEFSFVRPKKNKKEVFQIELRL